ncbi:MAG: hypothetical protein ABIH66_08745 [bacterium]
MPPFVKPARRAVLIAAMFCLWAALLPGAVPAGEKTVLAVTPGELLSGIVVTIDGRPYYLRLSSIEKEFFTFQPDPAVPAVDVAVVEEEPQSEAPVLIPVQIEDKVLAFGATLRLITPGGAQATVVIPPRRVFFSIPFNIPLRTDVHPDFKGKNAIVYVIPKITKKAQVDVSNTAEDGVVADIKYEGLAYLKLKDLLNRTNRRDMDGTLFFGREKTNRWSVFIENLFEKFDERDFAVMRDRVVSGKYNARFRLDSLQNLHSVAFGANLKAKQGKAAVEIGNVDRRVKDRTHASVFYGEESLMGMLRFEGVEVWSPPDRRPLSLRADRFGYQLSFLTEKKNTEFSGIFGNIKVEDYNDQGEIDDHFNFIFTWSRMFGQNKPYRRQKFLYSGEHKLEYYGRGSATWTRADFNFNISYNLYTLLYIRYYNDFARLTGSPRTPLWEDYFISLMRVQNYFDPDDPLNRWNLESIFIDFDWEREGKVNFNDSIRFGFSRFMRIYKYDVPVEMYFETDKERKFRPGMGISIRRYL